MNKKAIIHLIWLTACTKFVIVLTRLIIIAVIIIKTILIYLCIVKRFIKWEAWRTALLILCKYLFINWWSCWLSIKCTPSSAKYFMSSSQKPWWCQKIMLSVCWHSSCSSLFVFITFELYSQPTLRGCLRNKCPITTWLNLLVSIRNGPVTWCVLLHYLARHENSKCHSH